MTKRINGTGAKRAGTTDLLAAAKPSSTYLGGGSVDVNECDPNDRSCGPEPLVAPEADEAA